MRTDATGRARISTNKLIAWAVGFAVVFVIMISMVAASGNADPTDVAPGEQSLVTSVTNASVIVFREGLEAVLIFAAITASFLGGRRHYRRPVVLGVCAAFLTTVVTWFVLTAALGALPVSEDVLLAITGIAAVVILLLVMNWFFHKVYWTDHIKELNSKKRDLVEESESGDSIKFWGFFALGFTAVYREGFEVVLFLQNLNIVAGGAAVFWGVLIGLGGTAIVGFLTFYAHHKLPYKRMLVLTGVLLGLVLVVMIGGSVRTLQSLGIVSITPLPFNTPDWWARWFEIVPTYESVGIQLLAAAFVMGSYYAAEWWSKEKRRRARAAAAVAPKEAVVAPSALASTATPAPAQPVVPAAGAAASVAAAAVVDVTAAAVSVPRPAIAPRVASQASPTVSVPVAAPRVAPSAQRVHAATAALPQLALRAPNVAGSPAAVRVVERTRAAAPPAPRTICGHEATTLCGCDASQPVAAATMVAARQAAVPAAPTLTAPAFTPRPLFADSTERRPAAQLTGRETPFARRPFTAR